MILYGTLQNQIGVAMAYSVVLLSVSKERPSYSVVHLSIVQLSALPVQLELLFRPVGL